MLRARRTGMGEDAQTLTLTAASSLPPRAEKAKGKWPKGGGDPHLWT